MSFRRFLGLGDTLAPAERPAPQSPGETDTVRQIVARLESLPPDRARLLAATSYILARAANADLSISPEETAAMERLLAEGDGLDESQAILVVEMAKLQVRTVGGTEDYLVTRQFREIASAEQRLALLRACYVVEAADDAITSAESGTLDEIARELDVDREDVARVRAEFADKLVALRMARRMAAGADIGRGDGAG
jgi:uncharacterized tellurite resistance protein B-like protein